MASIQQAAWSTTRPPATVASGEKIAGAPGILAEVQEGMVSRLRKLWTPSAPTTSLGSTTPAAPTTIGSGRNVPDASQPQAPAREQGYVVAPRPTSTRSGVLVPGLVLAPPVAPPPVGGSSKVPSTARAPSRPLDVEKLFAALGKDYKREEECITTRDIIMNLDIVKAMAPRLLTDFTKIDREGLGRIGAKQLEDCAGPPSRELSRYELEQVWERLLSGRASDAHLPQDRIFLQDMSRHLDFVSSRVPGLLENFHQIDTDRSSSIERAEFDAFFGNGEAWLEARLAQLIGLESLKKQIRTFYWATRLDGLRRRSGSFVDTEEAHVLMFRGNAGVGKTTIARLVAGLLHKIGIIPTDTLVEVQRDQLVGDHIGATEKATEEAISRASGGVLFVDEAYRLSVDVFGVEAINCLMKAMSQRGRVIILAGYPDEMDKFISANPGLKRRITYEFTFPDYSPDDLARIFTHQVGRRGFEIDPRVTVDSIASTISRLTTELQRRALNGGAGEHMCRHAVFSLNSRQVDMIRASENAAQFVPSITLNMQDIEHGCRQVPHAPTSHKA